MTASTDKPKIGDCPQFVQFRLQFRGWFVAVAFVVFCFLGTNCVGCGGHPEGGAAEVVAWNSSKLREIEIRWRGELLRIERSEAPTTDKSSYDLLVDLLRQELSEKDWGTLAKSFGNLPYDRERSDFLDGVVDTAMEHFINKGKTEQVVWIIAMQCPLIDFDPWSFCQVPAWEPLEWRLATSLIFNDDRFSILLDFSEIKGGGTGIVPIFLKAYKQSKNDRIKGKIVACLGRAFPGLRLKRKPDAEFLVDVSLWYDKNAATSRLNGYYNFKHMSDYVPRSGGLFADADDEKESDAFDGVIPSVPLFITEHDKKDSKSK